MGVFKTVYGAVAYAIFATFVLLSSAALLLVSGVAADPRQRLEPGRHTAGLALAACKAWPVGCWCWWPPSQIDHFELTHARAAHAAISPTMRRTSPGRNGFSISGRPLAAMNLRAASRSACRR